MKRIGFADSVMMDALFPFFPVFLSFFLRKPPFLAAFFLHIWQIDETHMIAYNVRLYA